jgi:hypothetical protein
MTQVQRIDGVRSAVEGLRSDIAQGRRHTRQAMYALGVVGAGCLPTRLNCCLGRQAAVLVLAGLTAALREAATRVQGDAHARDRLSGVT